MNIEPSLLPSTQKTKKPSAPLPRVIVTSRDSVFLISFVYDAALVSAVKSFSGRRYDPDSKTWTVPEGAGVRTLIFERLSALPKAANILPKAYRMCFLQKSK